MPGAAAAYKGQEELLTGSAQADFYRYWQFACFFVVLRLQSLQGSIHNSCKPLKTHTDSAQHSDPDVPTDG
eukprot:9091-Heterococcus_DN1.PRE.2